MRVSKAECMCIAHCVVQIVEALDAKNEGDFKLAVARNPVLTLCSKFPKYPPHPTPGLIHETHLVLFCFLVLITLLRCT